MPPFRSKHDMPRPAPTDPLATLVLAASYASLKCCSPTANAWISFRYPSLHSNTSGLTVGHSRPMPGLARMAARICACATAPTPKVLVSAIGVSSVPSSSTCTRPTLLPKPLITDAAAGTLSRNGSPACGRITVTPVCSAPSSSVQCPTLTPCTSAIVPSGPHCNSPICGTSGNLCKPGNCVELMGDRASDRAHRASRHPAD